MPRLITPDTRGIIPINEIELSDFTRLAPDFGELLRDSSNSDLGLDFSNTVKRYGGSPEDAVGNFEKAQERYSRHERYQFAIITQGQLVGFSSVSEPPKVPDILSRNDNQDADLSLANLSLFICNPYRAQGLGKLSVAQQLTIIDTHYDGAWTTIRKSNEASQHLMTRVGFQHIGEQTGAWDSSRNEFREDEFVYTYFTRT